MPAIRITLSIIKVGDVYMTNLFDDRAENHNIVSVIINEIMTVFY